jgi:hypothetical protein
MGTLFELVDFSFLVQLLLPLMENGIIIAFVNIPAELQAFTTEKKSTVFLFKACLQ